jgi:predicted nucleotidyltransferase
MTSPLLGKAEIEHALTRLGERLERRGVTGDVYVIGGAAMALAYNTERVTRDIDAVFEPHGVVHDEAVEVALELGLPRWWLNEQASAYVSATPDAHRRSVFNHRGLRVSVISPRHLLAMKALAARRFADLDDIATLATLLQIESVDEVAAVCEEVFPGEPLTDRARAVVADALDQAG